MANPHFASIIYFPGRKFLAITYKQIYLKIPSHTTLLKLLELVFKNNQHMCNKIKGNYVKNKQER